MTPDIHLIVKKMGDNKSGADTSSYEQHPSDADISDEDVHDHMKDSMAEHVQCVKDGDAETAHEHMKAWMNGFNELVARKSDHSKPFHSMGGGLEND